MFSDEAKWWYVLPGVLLVAAVVGELRVSTASPLLLRPKPPLFHLLYALRGILYLYFFSFPFCPFPDLSCCCYTPVCFPHVATPTPSSLVHRALLAVTE